MTDIARTEREQAWLACYQQRVEARRERFRQASACCPDCAGASRSDSPDQARYHRRQAEQIAASAVQAAGESARALLTARRTNLISVAVIAVLALFILVLAAAVLVDA